MTSRISLRGRLLGIFSTGYNQHSSRGKIDYAYENAYEGEKRVQQAAPLREKA
jgi:hypothetical protein